jgi:hypothetical protein
MTRVNKKYTLILLVVIATLLRVYALMGTDWTTIELNEMLSPVGLTVNIATIIFVLRLRTVE